METRAKMSDKSHADLSRWAHCGAMLAHETTAEAYAAAAEREARAILAETEPDDAISYSWAGIGSGRGPAAKAHDGSQHQPWVYLAESLAAFVQS